MVDTIVEGAKMKVHFANPLTLLQLNPLNAAPGNSPVVTALVFRRNDYVIHQTVDTLRTRETSARNPLIHLLTITVLQIGACAQMELAFDWNLSVTKSGAVAMVKTKLISSLSTRDEPTLVWGRPVHMQR